MGPEQWSAEKYDLISYDEIGAGDLVRISALVFDGVVWTWARAFRVASVDRPAEGVIMLRVPDAHFGFVMVCGEKHINAGVLRVKEKV